MADLFSWWQQDLVILPSGDLLTVDGTIEGEQRVLRRLLTSPTSYIWHLEYGAGLPQQIGQPIQAQAVQALIITQMFLEDVVSQDPLPVVTVAKIVNGLSADIRYIDNDVGKLVTLQFDLNE